MKFGTVKLYCREDLPADTGEISNISKGLLTEFYSRLKLGVHKENGTRKSKSTV